MAVYVDKMRAPYGRLILCHMLADSISELQDMARALNLRDSWLQNRPVPHYDICLAKRKEAVRLGAVEIDRRTTGKLVRQWRQRLSEVDKPLPQSQPK